MDFVSGLSVNLSMDFLFGLPVNLSFVKEINFVLDENHGHVAALVLHLPFPGLDGLERRLVRRREDYDASLEKLM